MNRSWRRIRNDSKPASKLWKRKEQREVKPGEDNEWNVRLLTDLNDAMATSSAITIISLLYNNNKKLVEYVLAHIPE